MTQYGFFIDLSRCIGCNACVIACKQWHDIPPGPVKWLRVYQWEKGAFPAIDLRVLPIMCFHCENPVCAEACPHQAIYKEDKFGAVLVDPDKCQGERKCWEACPYGTPQYASDARSEHMSKCTMCLDRLEQGLKPICVLSCSLRALEFGPIDELRLKYEGNANIAELPREHPPCRIACPAGVDAGGYVELIAAGKMQEALDLFRETTPFAGVLGRICKHPCEADCRRGKFDDAVAICALKRFMADYERKAGNSRINTLPVTREEKVAVIGSGPAGLSCAYDLIHQGYAVTVFESAKRSGGLLRYGVAEYRLPRDILDYEIDYFARLGVDIRVSSPVTQLNDVFAQGYGAVFVATGAGQSQRLDVPGEDARGVNYALDFLARVNSGERVNPGRRVAVIGGGSVAIDAARVALRLGAREVHLVCLECRDLASGDRMPAQDWEIAEAEEEGVIIHACLGVSGILSKRGKVTGLETIGCTSVYDSDGRFAPRYSDTAGPGIAVDGIIVAIGQKVGNPLPGEKGMEYAPSGTILADPVTLETGMAGVFTGGDAVSGAASVIEAIAMGKEAAISIGRYLRGEDLKEGRQPRTKIVITRPGYQSCRPPILEKERRQGFDEVNLGFDEKSAIEQASQCVRCATTIPAVLFWPIDPKREVIPWDAKRTLELWQKRHADSGEQLPDIFKDVTDVTKNPADITGRNKLVLKPRSVEELMFYTTDDE
jgi:DMSO reductase iron-sulfur subunit